MADCDLCHNPTRNRKPQPVGNEQLLLCNPCRTWWNYWTSLTPQQQAAEQEAMARYACTCPHTSWAGVDATPMEDPDKTWRCDDCGRLATTRQMDLTDRLAEEPRL